MPPLPPREAAPIAPPDIVPASADEAPLGAQLRSIVLLANDDPVIGEAAPGVDVSRIDRLDRGWVRASLRRFLGRPLSRKMIAEIETEIAQQSRIIGRPFVSLSTPEQEITNGVLQIRVTEFRLGTVAVRGADGDVAQTVRDGVRLPYGEPIDSFRLGEDLDWLNRNPFTRVAARFAPAKGASDTTDLTLSVERDRPWRVYGGWTNGGSESTGRDRLFLGVMAALPGTRGGYASYQITGSDDFWYEDGNVLTDEPRYVAQGLRVYVPTFARENFEMTVSDALTNQQVNQYFSIRQRTTEVTYGYRSALSNLGLPAGLGDVLIGAEFKRQKRKVLFGELTALADEAEIWQGLIGVSKLWLGNGEQISASVNLHVSPGGISDRSSAERLALITDGRVTSDHYAYATFDLFGVTRLPGNLALSSQLSMQYARRPLPLPAQFGIGGEGLVRGYTADDGSYDRGFVIRNELRLPPVSFSELLNDGPDDLFTPFAFLDLAKGLDIAANRDVVAASAGIGADYRIGRHISMGINSAWALRDSRSTEAGDWSVQARVTASY